MPRAPRCWPRPEPAMSFPAPSGPWSARDWTLFPRPAWAPGSMAARRRPGPASTAGAACWRRTWPTRFRTRWRSLADLRRFARDYHQRGNHGTKHHDRARGRAHFLRVGVDRPDDSPADVAGAEDRE